METTQASAYGHLRGLEVHMRRTARALSLAGLHALALDLERQRQTVAEWLRENGELLRATETVPYRGRARARPEVGALPLAESSPGADRPIAGS